MNRKNFWYVLLSLLLVLSCNIPGQTISQPLPTSSPFFLPPTWTPQPTATDTPRTTEIVWSTFTAVPAITLRSNFTETPQGPWAGYIPLVSPNGNWVAYYNFNEIRIAKGEDNVWTLPCELFKDCSYIKAVGWSRDSKYLYFGASTYLGGTPDEIAYFSSAGKINVKTGQWERLFPDPRHYFDFTVSPDGKYVAFIEQYLSEHSVLLTILSFDTRERISYSANGFEGGDIVWSPYKPRVVFLTRDDTRGSSVVFFDVEVETMRYLLKDEPDQFSISAWQEDNLVLMYRTRQSGEIPYAWYLNPFTGELSPVPPTPMPTP